MKNICGITGLVLIAGLCASVAAARPVYQDSKSSSSVSRSTISVQSSDGTDTYEVRMNDGKVTAKRNGEAVPEDRIRRKQKPR